MVTADGNASNAVLGRDNTLWAVLILILTVNASNTVMGSENTLWAVIKLTRD
jgi:hypothetical protein